MLILIFDQIISINSSYYNKGIEILDRKKIIIYWAREIFCYDLITSGPLIWQIINELTGSSHNFNYDFENIATLLFLINIRKFN